MAFSTTRRFIAGAACPKCGLLDKVVAYAEEGASYRECVACGFKDEIRLNAQPRELETRVNRTREERDAEILSVKIIE